MKAISHLAERLRTETAVIMTHELYEDIETQLPILKAVAKAARGVVFMPNQDNPAWDRLTLALDALDMQERRGDGQQSGNIA